MPEMPVAVPVAANDRGPAALSPPKPVRPDLGEFSRAVKVRPRAPAPRAGQAVARRLSLRCGKRFGPPIREWGLSEIEFKDMLAGAHRAGPLVLASADLKNKKNIKEFENSAILYKNTVWHFVRVED